MASPDSPEQPNAPVRPLTLKQEGFVAAYLGDAKGNATEAARMAGYKHPESAAKDNLRNPPILARVQEHVAAKYATADQVLTELTDVGLAEWREFLVIKRNKDGDEVEVKMDLGSKVKSLELLGKYHKLFTEKIEHGGDIAITIAGVDVDQL